MNFKNKVIHGHVLDILKQIPDKSIDSCVTSPPYWHLRNYDTPPQIWSTINNCDHKFDHNNFCECGAWFGELGREPDFNIYINNLILVFNEIHRILKDNGVCFVNLDDSYSGSKKLKIRNKYYPKQSLCLLPYRFAIEMIDNGWICRNNINWRKPNQIPDPVKNRFTIDFEPVFLFTKMSTGYYFKQQFETYKEPLNRWGGKKLDGSIDSTWDKATGQKTHTNKNVRPYESGRNMRTTWDINTTPFKGAHFATFPKELAKRAILASCPVGGIVIDPFGGSGTTAEVAGELGRNYLICELNSNSIDIINNRLGKEFEIEL